MKPPSTPDLPFTGGSGSASPEEGAARSAPGGAPSPRGAPVRRPPAQPRYGRHALIFLIVIVAAVVAVAAVTGERGYLDVRRQKTDLEGLRAEVAALKRDNAALLAAVRGLRSDPFVIEAIARERLGYARPGEIIFQFPPETPPVAPTPPPAAR